MTKKVLRATLDTQINTMEGWLKQFQEDIKHARKPSRKRALNHTGAMIEDVIRSLKQLRTIKQNIGFAIAELQVDAKDKMIQHVIDVLQTLGERRINV